MEVTPTPHLNLDRNGASHCRTITAPCTGSWKQSSVIFFKNRLPFTVDPKKIKGRYIKNISDYNKSEKKKEELDTIVPKSGS